ncbi:dentin sialophosphoprotein [Pieris rapae]|uniref:dentin sialophosphoprotein n=1 Tax=Pieris rapae TaxID=64459 RepID=UPI000B92895A|nr:dentin sialophosphoprotein [Pieris rapae]
MAQAEDTELRDLVIEALEKNGSLAKIRALLRANIFLAFEDDCENIKQNESLDNILKLPEGILSLSIIHEFLEFCNLKNTLFVYMSESRQGNEYKVKTQRSLIDTLRLNKVSKDKEPILITLLKYFTKSQKHESSHESYEHGDHSTYTVEHDTSSSTSQSQSDNSSDEKNKIDLRLSLDNSDTDSSSDSRNKKSSEYVPNPDITVSDIDLDVPEEVKSCPESFPTVEKNKLSNTDSLIKTSEQKSFELKPFNLTDEKLLNTTGIPNSDDGIKENKIMANEFHTISSPSSESFKKENINLSSAMTTNLIPKLTPDQSYKNDHSLDYSYDFSSIPVSEKSLSNKLSEKQTSNQNSSSSYSDKQNSPRSISSISISDVADLISERSYVSRKSKISISQGKLQKDKSPDNISLKSSNNSSDFSHSPIPSLSNLSLDYHSD